jgi:alkylation response protein AidB-like acyl-CoA dehydrogenase
LTVSLGLDADQRDIRDVARRFLQARYPIENVRAHRLDAGPLGPSSWREICELGWSGIAVPPERGGAGYGTVERCLILEEAGRVLLPEPLLSCGVLAADAVAAAPRDPAADELLERIIGGTVRATLVAAGDLLGSGRPTGAIRVIDGALQGDAGLVLDGDRADVLLVAALRGDGTTGLFPVERGAAGLAVVSASLVDETRGFAAVRLDGVPARPLGDDDASVALQTVLDRGAIALAAEMVGAALQALDMTVAYLKERQQFGVAIGTFQALKHRMADAHVAVVAARESVYLAAEADDGNQPEVLGMVASAAKIAAGGALLRAAGEAIQMHGGIGMTQEANVHLYYKRALVSATMLGTSASHGERLAGAIGG